jgi:hypothetical protein
MRKTALVLFLCCSVGFLASGISFADSFAITDGSFGHSLTNGRGSFDFSGVDIRASGGIIDPLPNIFGPSLISAGTSFASFSTGVTETVSIPPSSFTVNGQLFSGRGAAYTLQVAGGPFTLPSALESLVTVEFPFTLTGSLFQCPSSTPCNSFGFPIHELSGHGIGSITFAGNTSSGSYSPQAFSATFAAPESSSFFLLGLGLVALGIWKRANGNKEIRA